MNKKKLVNFGTPGFASLGLEPYRVSIKDYRAFVQIPQYRFVPPGCWTVAHIDHTTLDVATFAAPLKRPQLRLPRNRISANTLRAHMSPEIREDLAPESVRRLQRQPQLPFTAQ